MGPSALPLLDYQLRCIKHWATQAVTSHTACRDFTKFKLGETFTLIGHPFVLGAQIECLVRPPLRLK